MTGWVMASLAAVGLFLLVLGSVVGEDGLIACGGVLVGWAAGFTSCRLATLSALKDLRS